MEEKIKLTMEHRDLLLNQKFQQLVAEMTKEVNSPPLGSICLICWSETDRASVSVQVPAHVPQAMQLKIVDLLSNAFVRVIQSVKTRIKTQRAPSSS
jgi:hypothetical protein